MQLRKAKKGGKEGLLKRAKCTGKREDSDTGSESDNIDAVLQSSLGLYQGYCIIQVRLCGNPYIGRQDGPPDSGAAASHLPAMALIGLLVSRQVKVQVEGAIAQVMRTPYQTETSTS